jgi:release factor glutamine methyltransferase
VPEDTSYLERITKRLSAAGCVAAREEADELIRCAHDDEALEVMVGRRERGEPLAWITGSVSFCGRRVRVHPGVYVPRPQTEELARRAATLLGETPCGAAADLCTGSGAVAVHLAASVPGVTVVATDVDPRAATCARANEVRAVVAYGGGALRTGAFDVVTAVAPYVPTGSMRLLPADVLRYEPLTALHGGSDGLDVARIIVVDAARLLTPGGWLLLEVGGNQDEALAGALAASGFALTELWHDAEGDLRGLTARRSPYA